MSYEINYDYLRLKKAQSLKDWYEKPFYKKEKLNVEVYNDATILPLKTFPEDNLLFGRGGVVDSNSNYITESAIFRRLEGSYDVSSEEYNYENKKVVYCGYFVNHWGHFLVEAISRLWYVLKNDNTIDNYVFFVCYNEEREISGNYRELFKLLGILDKIILINKPTRFREVVVPEMGYRWKSYYSSEFKDMLEFVSNRVIPNKNWNTYDKIFFTRSQLPTISKRELGVEMLDSFFVNNGYKIISPEKLQLSQLIYIMRNAKQCASVSGTLPHNLLFAKEGQKIIIIERMCLNTDHQVDINRIKNLEAIYIDANISPYTASGASAPSIMSYRGKLGNYAKDNNLNSPDEKFTTDKYLRQCLIKYLKEYKKLLGYQWFLVDWCTVYIDYVIEAYYDSLNYFGDYLRRKKALRWYEHFQLHFINIKLNIIIRKIKNKIKKIIK